MNYPGDTLVFVLSVQNTDGTVPTVTGTPTLTLVDALAGTPITSPALSMTKPTGTSGIYTCSWTATGVAPGTYLALVSYAAGALVYNNQLHETVKLGDTFVTGPVALDATVAKDSSVAKASLTLQKADYTAPDQSPLVQTIANNLLSLANNVPSTLAFSQLLQLVQNISDFCFGNWVIDKTQNVMTYFRENGAQLKKYLLSNSASESSRLQQR